MNRRFPANQPILLWGPAFRLVIVLLLCSTTIAAQLAPNPNPSGHTIMVHGPADNSLYFYNWGGINNQNTIDNSGTIDNWGTIENWGTINNKIGGTINNKIGSTIWNWGGLGTIYNSGTIDNSGHWGNFGTFNNQGIFKGTGTFDGNIYTRSGTVAPGSPAGTMYVTGSFGLLESGILDIEIGGFTPGTFDLLDIRMGAELLDGTINLSFLSGYDIASEISPGQSMTLQFLNANYISGHVPWVFTSDIMYDFLGSPSGFQYNVFQQGGGLFFEAINTNDPAVIPAPGAILLGGIGVGVVTWLRRRRML